MMLPRDVPAARTARAAVEGWLRDAPPNVRDDARSVVTELVANAVRYGRPPIQLKVERGADHWRIDVADAGSQRAWRRRGARGSGWGLRIVGALADSWGIAEDASRVWCRLPADADPAGRSNASEGGEMAAEHEQDPVRTEGEPADVDGAADADPGTVPEGATPKVSRKSGDPLADAHDSRPG